jgi:hypothetical protein
MIRKFMYTLVMLLTVGGAMLPGAAEAAVTVTVTGANTARADFALGGTPTSPQYTGTVFMTFESPIGLTAANLNVSAQIVSPSDPALLARLPGSGQVTVPSGFPVMISINPPASGGFEFINTAKVELYTTTLSFNAAIPYRLYKAPPGGMFYDITEDVVAGSIRCRSRTGGFSDFIMVVDSRSLLDIIEDKYAFLEARAGDDDIDPLTRTTLQLDLDESLEEFLEGDYEDARTELDDFELRVDTAAGVSIPNRWLAGGSLDNVAGSLESEATALDYALRQLIASGSGSGGGGEEEDD